MRRESGDWTRYRTLANLVEVDFHRSDEGPPEISYWEAMARVFDDALAALRDAQAQGKSWVLFTHGSSTSRLGKTTARSVVRGLIRSKAATPHVLRARCIQHPTVFVAAIRPKK
jgi:hypothetical protein